MAVQRQLEFHDYVRILRRRWALILLLTVVGTGVGYTMFRVLPKQYVSMTSVLVQQPTVPTDYVKPVVTDDTNQRLAAMKQQILSRTRLEPLIHDLGLYRKDIDRVPMEDLVARLQSAVKVDPVQAMAETQAHHLPGFNITVTFDDARQAQQICSNVTSMFISRDSQLRQEQANQTTQFVQKQLDDAKAKLDEMDNRLAAFKRRYLGSLPDQEQANLNLLMNLTTQLEASTQALSRAQQDKSFAESMLAQQLTSWQASQKGNNPQTLQQQLADLQSQLSLAQAKYTDNHPDVIKLKNDIEAVNKKIADGSSLKGQDDPGSGNQTAIEPPSIQQYRAQIHQLEQTIKDRQNEQSEIQKQIGIYQARVQSSPDVEEQYKELTRDHQTALDFYNKLLGMRDQSSMANDLQRRQEGEQFAILDPANLPDRPSFPKLTYCLGGGFGGGLALGLGLCMLLEMQDSSLRSDKDVEFTLRLPVLAMIPRVECSRPKARQGKNELLLTDSSTSRGVRVRV